MDRPGVHQNLGPVFVAVDVICFAFSTAAVLARLVTRIWITHNFGWDDATIALAQVRSFSHDRQSLTQTR